jgi:hypothetical protein
MDGERAQRGILAEAMPVLVAISKAESPAETGSTGACVVSALSNRVPLAVWGEP